MKRMQYATLLLALAVITAAFGAHGLKPYAEQGLVNIDSWQVAISQHFYHGFAILILSAIHEFFGWKGREMNWATTFMLFGLLFFSGSVYLLSCQKLMGMNLSFLGPVTPIGGLCFIAGWIFAFIAIRKNTSKVKSSMTKS